MKEYIEKKYGEISKMDLEKKAELFCNLYNELVTVLEVDFRAEINLQVIQLIKKNGTETNSVSSAD